MGAELAAGLATFLRLAPQGGNVGTMTQTATFVKKEAEEEVRKEAERTTAKPYTSEYFRQQADNIELWKRLDSTTAQYKSLKQDLAIYQTVSHLGDSLLYEGLKLYPWTAPAFAFFSTVENKKIKNIKAMEKQLEIDHLEWLRRVDIRPADHRRLKEMPLEQAVAEVHALSEANFWQHYTVEGQLLPPVVRSEYERVMTNILRTKEELPLERNTPSTQTNEAFARSVQITINNARTIQEFPDQLRMEFEQYGQFARETYNELRGMASQLEHLEAGSEQQLKASKFLLDIQYKNLSTAEKIDGIKRGLYPERIGEFDTLVVLQRWEERERTVMQVTGYAQMATGIARDLGVHLPRDLEKGIMASQHVFHAIMGISTGNPLQVITSLGAIVGLFKGTGPDIGTHRHQEIMDAFSRVFENQRQMANALSRIQQLLIQHYEMNIQLARAVNELGIFVLQNHAQTMALLHRVDEDVLYNREVLIQIHLNHIREFEDLRTARAHRTYSCANGIFESLPQASLFFQEHFSTLRRLMNTNFTLFQTSNLDPALRFTGAYSSRGDASDLPETNRAFETQIWGQSYSYYSHLSSEERKRVRKALFEPVIYVGSLDRALAGPWLTDPTFEPVRDFTKTWFSHLIAPKILIDAGQFTIDFHRYYPLIKNFQTGELYTLQEMIDIHRIMTEPQEKGLRVLERIFTFTNLAIAQHHLLSGGPLIPLFYEKFLANLANFTETIRNRNTTEEQKRKLQEDVRNAVNLLGRNPIFAKNVLLYALRKKLDIREDDPQKELKCLNYRMAYNFEKDPTALRQLFAGWEFFPRESSRYSKGHGWDLVIPFNVPTDQPVQANEELKIELPHPSDLYYGRLDYPLDLQKLVQLRETLIQEIVGYKINEKIADQPKLKEMLGNSILRY